MNRTKIYWICQIGGWSLLAVFNLVLFVLDDETLIPAELTAQLLLTGYYILSTHIYRNLIIRWGWLRILNPKLIPRIILSIIVLSASCLLFEAIL